ncbi:O-antigen ligase family protein [Marmoricola sp. RAF53]|uniref:O-antigen ligase family protein n=1 Tax=Marmoricola sp. RAF53 TaxID=3233059 RepID=UPI003F9C8AC6
MRSAADQPVRALALLVLAYPCAWLLGVQWLLWPVCGLAAAGWLLANRGRIRLGPVHLAWLVLLAWIVLSGTMLTDGRYAAAWGYRLLMDASVLLVVLAVHTALRAGARTQPVVDALCLLWAASVLLGTLGVLLPGLSLVSPAERLLPEGLGQIPFLRALTHPALSELDDLYGVPRPSALYPYTNDWGAAVSILTPVAVYAAITARTAARRALLVCTLLLSLVPVVVSVNRGCWLSLVLAAVVVVARQTLAGRAGAFLVVGALAATVAGLLLLTPLGAVVSDRLAVSNTHTRSNLYAASWQLARASPVFGYGAPQSSAGLDDSNDVSIGTHGQLWTVLVSQGIVGAALYLAALLVTVLRSWPPARSPAVWLHVTGPVLLLQSVFYDALPVPLCVFLLCASVARTRTDRPVPSLSKGTAA